MAALVLDRQGWLKPAPGLLHRPSPNFDARPKGVEPTLLVLHNISLPPGQFGGHQVIEFFQNRLNIDSHPWFENIRDVRVSAHFFIRRNGNVVQFVSTLQRAWHAGVSSLNGRERCNDFSIGIELEGTDTGPYDDAQYDTLRDLTAALRARHTITHVRGHEHIAPGRKTDPGPEFNWRRYGQEAQWPRRLLPPPA